MRYLKIAFALAAVLLFVACGDANERYVRKAVKIMDRQGLYAQGEQWEAAKAEALAAHPVSHAEAVETVQQALKVAGGKHSFILSADEVVGNDTGSWAMPSVTASPSSRCRPSVAKRAMAAAMPPRCLRRCPAGSMASSLTCATTEEVTCTP